MGSMVVGIGACSKVLCSIQKRPCYTLDEAHHLRDGCVAVLQETPRVKFNAPRRVLCERFTLWIADWEVHTPGRKLPKKLQGKLIATSFLGASLKYSLSQFTWGGVQMPQTPCNARSEILWLPGTPLGRRAAVLLEDGDRVFQKLRDAGKRHLGTLALVHASTVWGWNGRAAQNVLH